jgi:hypothetical protein
MVQKYSVVDYLLNRPRKPEPFTTGIFRNVYGRLAAPVDAAPVRVSNKDGYGMSQAVYTLGAANTEYTIQGIATMASIIVKARGGAVKLSIYEGQSNLTYTLISDGQALEISVVPFAEIERPVNLYAQSTTAGCVVEILGLSIMNPKNENALTR